MQNADNTCIHVNQTRLNTTTTSFHPRSQQRHVHLIVKFESIVSMRQVAEAGPDVTQPLIRG
jgi:hypothetical protein